MSNNRIIIKLKRVPSLVDSSMDLIQNGELFLNDSDNGLYFKNNEGQIIGLTDLKPFSPEKIDYDDKDGSLLIDFGNNGTDGMLVPFSTIIRFISPVESINSKIKIKGIDDTFTIEDLFGKEISKGEIKKDMLTQLIYIGDNKFRLMSGGSGLTIDEDGKVVIDNSVTITGDLQVDGSISGIKKKDIEDLVREIANDGIAVGTIISFIKEPLPPGFLRLNGNQFSKDLYPDLFNYLGTDVLPDATDIFLKGIGSTIKLGETKGAYINMPINVKGVQNSVNGFLSPMLIEAGGEEVYNAGGMNANHNSDMDKTFDVAPKSLGVVWAIKAGSVYVDPGKIDLNAVMDKLDDTYRASEVDKKFIKYDDIRNSLGSKDDKNVPSMSLIDSFNIPTITTDVSALKEMIIQLESSMSEKIIGDIRLFPFRLEELPVGWYAATGDLYSTTSDIGKVLNSLPQSYKDDFKIKIENNQINTPNLINSDGRGFFLRAGKIPGKIQDDAIRNITGNSYGYNSSSFTVGISGYNSGVFKTTEAGYAMMDREQPQNFIRSDYETPKEARNGNILEFDASKVVPTAEENRPLNISFTPAIYLGII